jgi:hypothetical protein
MRGTVEAAVSCGVILLAMAIGYLAGTPTATTAARQHATRGTAAPPLDSVRGIK